MRKLIGEHNDAEILSLANQVRLWGYPREIPELEVDLSCWMTYCAPEALDCILWLSPWDRPRRQASFHACFAPEVRSRIYLRGMFDRLRVILEWLGYEEVVGQVDEGWESRKYLERLGWRWDESSSLWRVPVGEFGWARKR